MINTKIQKYRLNRRGDLTISLIGYILISALLISGSLIGFTQVERAKVDATATDLQLFATDIEAVMEDIGVLELPAGSSEIKKKGDVTNFLTRLEREYTNTTFTEPIITEDNFIVETVELKDSWDQPYTFVYNTNPAKGKAGTCMFISAGKNLVLEMEEYGEGNFYDDILVIITPRY